MKPSSAKISLTSDAIKVNRTQVSFAEPANGHQPSPATQTGATVRYGIIDIGGVKGIKQEFDPSKTIVSLRKVDESNGYKHLYVLWADMRNDGSANADGGMRKEDFGLVLPTSKNYKISVALADNMTRMEILMFLLI